MSSGFLVPTRRLPDGRMLNVAPLLFGRARLTVSYEGDEYGYYDGW